MALLRGLNDGIVQVGNREDVCYLCEKELRDKKPDDLVKQLAELKGQLDGQKVVKIKRYGNETVICLKHIHKIASENPLDKE